MVESKSRNGVCGTSRLTDAYDSMSFDDVEEALADTPRNERWELIGGRVVRPMVGGTGVRVLDGLDAVLPLPAIDVSIPFRSIYRRVF